MNLFASIQASLSTFSFDPKMLLICALASLVPILGWIYFFQKQNQEKKWYVLLTFVAGMFSVLPIKLYEKYWDSSVLYFEHINIFQYLADLVKFPEVSRFLSFISVNAIVAIGLFLFVALLMFVLEILTGDNSGRVFAHKTKIISESPFFFATVGILCGVVAFSTSISLPKEVWFFVMVGMLEEYIKHLVTRFSDEEKIRSVDDAISFSIIAALGFAFVENIFYLQSFMAQNEDNLRNLSFFFVLRSTVSVMAHVCFSAILGYFYGVAKFSSEIYQEESRFKRFPIIGLFHSMIHLKKETLFHEEKMMEGMLLAMVVHAIFNSLLQFNQITLIIPFLLIMFYMVLSLFHRKQIHSQVGNLRDMLGGTASG